jgi:hypothetical protein
MHLSPIVANSWGVAAQESGFSVPEPDDLRTRAGSRQRQNEAEEIPRLDIVNDNGRYHSSGLLSATCEKDQIA